MTSGELSRLLLQRLVQQAHGRVTVDALDRGDFVEVDDADLEGYLERVPMPAARPAR